MNPQFKKWLPLWLTLAGFGLMALISFSLFQKAAELSFVSLQEMLFVIPPVFVLMGILDVFVEREKVMKWLGHGSGFKGTALAFLMGSMAAGPLYGAFPVAAVFLKKGVSFFNILIFLGAWSTTKIPMLLFEAVSLGKTFTLSRLILDVAGIFLMSVLISRLVKEKEIEKIRQGAEKFLEK